MEKMSFEEFAAEQIARWAKAVAEGKELPSVVRRFLQGGYKHYTKDPEEEKRERAAVLKKIGFSDKEIEEEIRHL